MIKTLLHKFSDWLQDDIDEQYRPEFNEHLYKYNLERLFLITGLGICAFFMLAILDYFRLIENWFQGGWIYTILFGTHLLLLSLILPALFIQHNANSIWYGFQKHKRALFIFCLFMLTFSLLPMAIISFQLRGSVITLAIYAIIINIFFKLPRKTTFWLNFATLVVVTTAIVMMQWNLHTSKMLENILECWGVLVFVFLISTDQFNFEVKRFNYEKMLEEKNTIIQSSLQAEFNKKITEIEMTALRAQMNPHFLFNVLNSIKYYMVQNDARTASRYLTKFAQLIRLILNNSKSHMVKLNDELKALELYIEMESFRFNNKFDYTIEVENGVATEQIDIPPLILQPFVENAIWHGLMHKEDGRGQISIQVKPCEQDDHTICFVIEDNGIGREKAGIIKTRSATQHKSVGTKITQDRIEMTNKLYETNAKVEIVDLKDAYTAKPIGTRVIVHLPIPSKISTEYLV